MISYPHPPPLQKHRAYCYISEIFYFQFVLLFMLADYDGIEFQGYRFPGWAEGIAWFIAAIPVFMIPLWMFIILYQSLGSWKVNATTSLLMVLTYSNNIVI